MPKIEINRLVTKVSSSIKARDLSAKGDFPVYGAQGISGYSKSFQTPVRSIAIIKDGAGVGRVQIIPSNSSVIGTLQLLVPKKDVDVSYLFYLFSSMDLGKSFSGATIPHIYFKDYGQNCVNDNSYTFQKEIGVTLDLISNVIESTKHYIFSLNELIKSRFIEMFGSEETIKSMDNVCSICRGASPRPISAYVTKGDGVNWIKIGDVQEDDIYINKTSEKITKEGALKSRFVKPGDFILSNSMSFGRPYILGINGCVHDGWLIISNYEKYMNPLFFYYEIRSKFVQEQFDGSAYGTCVRNLNSDLVRKVRIHVPTLNKQKQFVDFANQVDKLKFNAQKRIDLYQELLNKKMDEYFN